MNREPETKQVDTVQLAPDALIYINGSDVIKDGYGNEFEIRNDISEVSTSSNVDSPPGTANFTISLPDHAIRRTEGYNRYSSLKVMDEIEIYYRGRFPRKGGITSEKTNTLIYPYYPAFWGIISSITENFSDGVQSITVSCSDMLRWWQITSHTINPAAIASASNTELKTELKRTGNEKDNQTGQGKILPYYKPTDGRSMSSAGTFAQMTIPQILVNLADVTLAKLAPPDLLAPDKSSLGTADSITGEIKKFADLEIGILRYWKMRLEQIGKRLRIYGVEYKVDPKKPEGKKIVFNEADLKLVMPYAYDENNPSALQSIVRTNYEIAMEIKETIKWEFYQDVTGDIIFKPPFYNMDVKQNLFSVIEDLDIISWNFTQSESEVVTRMDVQGSQWQASTQTESPAVKGVAYDYKKAQKYGLRTEVRSVRYLTTPEKCLRYAQMELNRMNALIMKGNITIVGRPELKLGYPVYVPSRDAFYYVTGIDHSLSFGGSFTTQLSITSERRKNIDANGQKIENEMFRLIGEVIKDDSVPVIGSSEADKTEDNFIKNIIDPCIPKKKNKSGDSIVEPNFLQDTTDTVSFMPLGVWESTKAIAGVGSKTEYNTTDQNGYDLVPFFEYAKNLNFSVDSKIKKIDEFRQQTKENAEKAHSLSPLDYALEVSPTNVALVFDDEDYSMLNIFDDGPLTRAQKAQQAQRWRTQARRDNNLDVNPSGMPLDAVG